MEQSTRFLILSLEGEHYAFRITSLLEITVPRGIQKDAKLSEIFEGKMNHRNKMIPVVNLKKILKLSGPPGAVLLVMQSSKGILGLLADSVIELLDSTQKPFPMPPGVVDPSLPYFAGVLKDKQGLVLLLSEDGLWP